MSTQNQIFGEELKLFHYWRSSCSWRVRWALNLKKLSAEMIPVSLLDGSVESAAHHARNPFDFVPVLQVGNRFLCESVAILEFIDAAVGGHSLYSGDLFQKTKIRTLVEVINSGTQPIQNLNVMDMVSETDQDRRKEWCQHFIRRGLLAYQEHLVRQGHGMFSVGDAVTAADLCLIPQCYNALRFEIDLAKEFPVLNEIYLRALATPECAAAHPDRYQPSK